jgi:hypothetical protein
LLFAASRATSSAKHWPTMPLSRQHPKPRHKSPAASGDQNPFHPRNPRLN